MDFNLNNTLQQLQPQQSASKIDMFPLPQFSNAMQQDMTLEQGFDEASFDAAFTRFLLSHGALQDTPDIGVGVPPLPNPQLPMSNLNFGGEGFGNVFSPPPPNFQPQGPAPVRPTSPNRMPTHPPPPTPSLASGQGGISIQKPHHHPQPSFPGPMMLPNSPMPRMPQPGIRPSPMMGGPGIGPGIQPMPFGAMDGPRPPMFTGKFAIPAGAASNYAHSVMDDDDDERQAKRFSHIVSEQKRRNNIKDGFKVLQDVLPNVRPGTTRAALLRKSVDYINTLKRKNKELAAQVAHGGGGEGIKQEVSQESQEYLALVQALSSRLRISAKDPAPDFELAYKVGGNRVELTCGEDLKDLFEKYRDDPSEEVKVQLYIKKPPQYLPRRMQEEDNKSAVLRLQEGKEVGEAESVNEEESVTADHPIHKLEEDEGYELMDLSVKVDPMLIEHLYQQLKSSPLIGAGSPRYQTEEWQRARVRRALKACNNDVEDARVFLTNHLEWLAKVKPEAITKEELSRELAANKLYWHKCDLKGNPVLICRVARHIVEGGDQKYGNVKLWLYKLNEFETIRADSPYRKFTIIYDRRGTSMKNSDVWLLRKLLQFIQVNYTGMVHRIYVINPDYAFMYGYNLLKGLLTHAFRERVKFLDDTRWQQQLIGMVGRENLESDMGGICNVEYDEDGLIVQ